ncbi:penicillin acylase family protein [Actinacidiphila bryophytorum]|uniref:Acyl-homoserine lactone (AHL) acylase PvdQ n=1 Tax=Actinacidiphila bryophytorum TaxID=1436133 RepID=A0A9W4MGS1_9ACTN|nr:penicillin acylase family protein [Actinacidiphila bryophytorum]MBM9437875.1 penicillin acylase family protein [Actinacidiphila bryophytorum]MBN6542732.1 penicillin acylase family protein [Actinacidiphila bryophytorum]CAG7657253.1 Acyl-homoserine lactone (AHL) acylase PvdQ [Actinacidiphila bryophytorum]
MPLRTPRRIGRIGTLRTATAGALLALAATLVAPVPLAAHAADAGDYCAGQCADILPPGENGNATLADILANKAFGTRPAHTMDQLGPYADLANGYQNLTDATITSFFNDSSFGVPQDQVASVSSPRSDVTITRDKKTGVPHIKGTTRQGTEFGAGYAAAQDRLWLMDLFRHVGRGELSSFAGGAAANRGLEQEFWKQAPYTEADLQAQIDQLANSSGARGQQALADAQAYVDGINAYITASKNGRYFPGEYVLTGHVDAITNAGTIDPFKLTDLIALASVVGALFGTGGGGEVQSALSLLAAQQQYGVTEGTKVWESFRERDDPEATATVHDGTSFPYAGKPAAAQGEALPDAGSVVPEPLVYDATGGATQATTASPGVLPGNLFSTKKGMSNALVVSGAHTAGGHPVAVFGPQTGYFAPQLLMLQELQGPGISARGASFAGLGMYVELGRGQDYAWSATSASQDVTDTYAVELCQDATHYLFHGQCVAMEKLERTNSWKPTLADSTAAGSYRMQIWRTAYGPVEYRATVGGKAVAYTQLRSSYRHEADSILGFQELNDPGFVHDAASFQRAAQDINYTFNWFYADSRQTAYYNSGTNPVRADGVDASFPVWAQSAYDWRGWDPATNTASYTPPSQHPQSVDQDYYVSWNNKQAPGYTSAGFGNGAVHRADLLDDRVKALVHTGGVTRSALVKAMDDAALTDLRGEDVLPELLQVINSAPVTDPQEAAAVQQLTAWSAAGAKRHETSAGSHTYANADAVRVMDAWWPLLVQGEFQPGLGGGLYTALTADLTVDESPSAGHGPTGSHAGSAFQYGWWSYVDKDIRQVLGAPVAGPLARAYCGGGEKAACRDVLLSTLKQAAAVPAASVYPGDDGCGAGDQWCADSIVQRPLGGVTDDRISWQNRPTYQQVVEFPTHR